jgi:hypothetical protein
MDFSAKHPETRCPLRVSSYCSHCADYGHVTKDCPAKPPRFFTEPIYMEQLLSPSDREEYKITSRTLLPKKIKEDLPQLLEVEDNDKVIAAYLAARSIKLQQKPSKTRKISSKTLTLRYTLEEYAKINKMRVVYIK